MSFLSKSFFESIGIEFVTEWYVSSGTMSDRPMYIDIQENYLYLVISNRFSWNPSSFISVQ